ncbi:helix-turn-helix transcriptional regulator [Glaciibacter flavus]|uniref:Helix-turn-helix transcriptional regulator n=1 Tax=Orlajensenia flava TaxID=2565934 RepID=A0A4S4FY81_9MICO|nr:helix-turn-helix domain-containing protein [Glaciibacter flavus]THG34975.1 helix-turn-helix transcriptional regulator [Glaciibacter flavus]
MNTIRTDAAAADGLAGLAALMGDRTRATVCLALLDGRAWTAGELARVCGVSAATMSRHLDLLTSGGLLAEQRQGRHRYVRFADAGAAEVVESLAAASHTPRPPTSYAAARVDEGLRRARTCYDHLAGRLGVAVLDGLEQTGYVERSAGLRLTDHGSRWLRRLGIDISEPRGGRRPIVRECLDWTERRSHLAGVVGADLFRVFVDEGWIRRGEQRLVLITEVGADALRRELGVTVE